LKKLWRSGVQSEMQKILSYIGVGVLCLLIGFGAGEVRRVKADRSYRERLAIYIAEVERIRELHSSLEDTNRTLRAELEHQRRTLEEARDIVDGFEDSVSESTGGIRRALAGLQALRDLIEALESY